MGPRLQSTARASLWSINTSFTSYGSFWYLWVFFDVFVHVSISLWFTVPLLWTSTTLIWSCTWTHQLWLFLFFLVWCWSEYAILYVTFIWSFLLLMFNFYVSFVIFRFFSIFCKLPNFVYLSFCSLMFPVLPLVWLVGNIPMLNTNWVGWASNDVWCVLWIAMASAHRTYPVGFGFHVLFSIFQVH
jgi:hypothetical protein